MVTSKGRGKAHISIAGANGARDTVQLQETRHSLRVHQIELETQNEELRRIQVDLDAERARYFDLYDTAPVGYCTVSAEGLILEANHTVAKLLGATRGELEKQLFQRFIQTDDQDLYYLNRKQLVETGTAQECELKMLPKHGAPLWTKLMATRVPCGSGSFVLRIVLIDISERKRVERDLQKSQQLLSVSERQMVIAQGISGTGSWTYDLHAKRIWGSAEGLRCFGYPAVARDFPVEEIEACIPERVRVHQALVDLIQEGHAYDLEFAINPADGSPQRIVHSVATMDRDARSAQQLVLGFVQDITKVRQMDEQIRQLAFFDSLTGLPNRRLFVDRLRQAITAGQRSACYGALLYLDLDNFKPLNDTHGHEAGDLLLIEVAARLNRCVRETDTVARMGGDEFVVLMGGLHLEETQSTQEAMRVAEKVRTALASPYLLHIRRPEKDGAPPISHDCTASIGVVVFSEGDHSQEDILQCADAAMYRAKEHGRNQVCLSEPPRGVADVH